MPTLLIHIFMKKKKEKKKSSSDFQNVDKYFFLGVITPKMSSLYIIVIDRLFFIKYSNKRESSTFVGCHYKENDGH